jgi:hypothetical protein
MDEFVSLYDYKDALKIIIQSIDIYGLGFTIQHVANCFYQLNGINIEFYEKITKLCEKMYNFNIMKRELNVNLLVEEYLDILKETGLLKKGGKRRHKTNKKKTKKEINKIIYIINDWICKQSSK